MSFNRFVLPYTFTVNGQGTPYENAYLIFYQTDQVTQQTTYSDYLCTVPSTTVPIMYNSTLVNAVQANASGVFPTIFMPADNTYYWVLLDKNLNTLKTENHYSVPSESTLTSNQFVVFNGDTYIGRQSIEIVGTTYNVTTATSWGNIITFNNPNPVAVTIAAPSPTAFPAGWVASFQNIGAGVVTITGGANINGSPTIVLKNGDGVDISSDGSIFNAQTGLAELSYLNSGLPLTVSSNTITVTNSRHLINTASAAQTINTINGGINGQVLILQPSSISNTATINAGSTIKLQSGLSVVLTQLSDNIVLLRDETNTFWTEISRSLQSGSLLFTKSFTSSDQTFSFGTAVTVAHGLGVVPKIVITLLICQTADAGFATNDVVSIANSSTDADGGGTSKGFVTWIDSTNVNCRFEQQGYLLANKTNGAAQTAITAANWKLRIIAYA